MSTKIIKLNNEDEYLYQEDYNFDLLNQRNEQFYRKNGLIKWGSDNQFPKFLLDLTSKSSLHTAILKDKVDFVFGNGLQMVDEQLSLIANKYSTMDLNEVLFNITQDLVCFGGFSLGIRWSRDLKNIVAIDYIDIQKVRIFNENDVEYYVIMTANNKVSTQKFCKFDPNKPTAEYTILYCKENNLNQLYYPTPDYYGGLNWIELDYQISQFHLRNIKNGFMPSVICNFKTGDMTEEERDTYARKTRKDFQGSLNAGEVVMAFTKEGEEPPSFTTFNGTDNDVKFIQLQGDVLQGILCAHRVTNPELFSIQTPGKLGNNSDLSNSLNIFNIKYVQPKQKFILKYLNEIAAINGLPDFEIDPFKLKLDANLMDVMSILNMSVSNETKKELLKLANLSDEQITKMIPEQEAPVI
jgi:hypothetical protein